MKTRLKITPIALLVLLGLLTLIAVKRRHLTAQQAEDDVVQTAVDLEARVDRDDYAVVALLALIALFAFLMWTALRAKEGEDAAMPPARESSASSTTDFP